MLGSVFIHEVDSKRLLALEASLDNLDALTTVQLDAMLTLDFEELSQEAGASWSQGEPVVYNADSGIAVFRVSPRTIELLLSKPDLVSREQLPDIEKLRQFVAKHGADNLYELATF